MNESLRLDKAMVARGLVPSRTRAGQLIAQGQVSVDRAVIQKAATSVAGHQTIEVRDQDPWVSRSAHKLDGVLVASPQIQVQGRRCLDAGASTGGFTQVLLERGAQQVVAVDVGHDQLHPQLAADPRVQNHEGLNLRHLNPQDLGEPFDLIVADLSFISLRLVLPALAGQASKDADLLLMVKPQFEIGRERLGRTGVVSSPLLRREAVEAVLTAAEAQRLQLVEIHRSGLPGQDGNVEFFLHLRSTEHAAPASAEADTLRSDRLGSVEFD
ncbi:MULTISPECIES: TlyA family RNA methyltransferase [unclassified Nesterenkonia]|uniref:TlyA family RNA methyltransferase n=1 Tax=unclassified Nesterenkonia TaxID=2629769 RepID=UPI001F4D2BA9|nr:MULTISPECIES: TlyA family RNA methyltransferase [unclassified Nesterenkonia]MCH8561078.1 TlyA family RNA methyltransferase [Nesterenkonia sp. DZ6]MCH8562620.1 TlyA family RNA methyltransferase [Nesterenkonia sp. YGD6]